MPLGSFRLNTLSAVAATTSSGIPSFIATTAYTDGNQAAVDSSGNIYWWYNSGTLVKYNSTGTIVWAKEFYSIGNIRNKDSLIIDSADNLYIAYGEGGASALAQINTSTGAINWAQVLNDGTGIKAVDSNGSSVIIAYSTPTSPNYAGVAVFNTSGTLQRSVGNYYNNATYLNELTTIHSICIGSTGYVAMGCDVQYADRTTYEGIIAYNASTTIAYRKSFASHVGYGLRNIYALVMDSSNQVHFGGYIAPTATSNVSTDNHSSIFKLTSSGTVSWQTSITTSGYDTMSWQDCDIDSSGNTYWIGLKSGNLETVILKLDSSGSQVWARKITKGTQTVIFNNINISGTQMIISGVVNSDTSVMLSLPTDGTLTSSGFGPSNAYAYQTLSLTLASQSITFATTMIGSNSTGTRTASTGAASNGNATRTSATVTTL